jgi:VIT1/CCC1 family predicted Fe2+/Mn2+ transporter
VASLVLGVTAAAVVGWLIGRSTERPLIRSVTRQVLFTLVPALITFGIGNALGVGTT